MNNNTKIRLHLSKNLFESIAKEVLAEAGAKPGLGLKIGRGLLGAATGVAKMFDPKLGAQMSQMHQASDLQGKRDAQAAKLQQQRQGARTAKALAAQAAANPIPKQLSDFAKILPKHVSVTRRDPLVINYKSQDFKYDTATKMWKNIAGKTVPNDLEMLLTGWAEDINDFDPQPTASQLTTVAKVNTSQGPAVKGSNNLWFLNNQQVTDPKIIDLLDRSARSTGQIQ
jgi:hypothetical protein